MAGACGGLERDEGAVDRNDEDVSLAALEPTKACEGRAGLAMEVIASSVRRAASSIVSAYAWVRPRPGGFTRPGEQCRIWPVGFHVCYVVNSFAGAGSCMFALRG